MELTIRPATLDDVGAVAVAFDAYRQFYGQPADIAGAAGFLGERLQRQQSILLRADLDGDLAGFAQLYPCFSSVRLRPTWILNDLFVLPTARRHGVGRQLLDAAARAAQDRGAPVIALETARDNAAARALYRAAGWHEDATQWYSLELHAPQTVN